MISAYRIGGKVWLIRTDTVADPMPPGTIPLGSMRLKRSEVLMLCVQMLEAQDELDKAGGLTSPKRSPNAAAKALKLARSERDTS